MSDFAKLLGKLQDTANTVKKETATAAASNNNFPSKKRKFPHQHEPPPSQTISRRKQEKEVNSNTPLQPRRPYDAKDLNIEISFLCIGAQKAGTTWLHEMLKRHPDLSLPDEKELHFFDWHRRKGLKWYSRQWPRSQPSCLSGEITPCYAVLNADMISEIKYLFPSVKIIFLARDLVDRAWSAILMELRNIALGMEAGKFAKDGAITNMDQRTKQKYLKDADPNKYDDNYFMDRLMHATHRERSDYAFAIRNWLRCFPKEQILILKYEDVSKRPRDLLKEICSFIGARRISHDDLGEFFPEDVIQKRFNVASDAKLQQPIRPALRKKMELFLEPFAKDFNKLLLELGYTWKLDDYSKNSNA